MKGEMIRISSPLAVNESKLLSAIGYDVLFDGYQEFVYIPAHNSWLDVNGTWMGALGALHNDSTNGLKAFANILFLCNRFSKHKIYTHDTILNDPFLYKVQSTRCTIQHT
jgi:hypothetical protein